MEPNLIIFDMDDVMWNLNEKVAEINGIDYNKMSVFSVHDNPNLTDNEKSCILNSYTKAETFKDIVFIKPVIDLINKIYHDYTEYPVHIVSNCGSYDVRDMKMPQLLNVLDLPEEYIHLNVIDLNMPQKKKLPDNIFIFVDDSPHNILKANAVHKIMPARLHNDVLVDGYLEGCKVERPKGDIELVESVMHYINAK